MTIALVGISDLSLFGSINYAAVRPNFYQEQGKWGKGKWLQNEAQ